MNVHDVNLPWAAALAALLVMLAAVSIVRRRRRRFDPHAFEDPRGPVRERHVWRSFNVLAVDKEQARTHPGIPRAGERYPAIGHSSMIADEAHVSHVKGERFKVRVLYRRRRTETGAA